MKSQDPAPIPAGRLSEYAAREAKHPDLGRFEGGAPATGLWLGVAVLCLLVIALYYLVVDPNKVHPGN